MATVLVGMQVPFAFCQAGISSCIEISFLFPTDSDASVTFSTLVAIVRAFSFIGTSNVDK